MTTPDLTDADGTDAEELPSTAPDDSAAPDDAAGAPETPEDGTEEPEDGETFPRAVVERLRRENASYRTRAAEADQLAARLHTAQVAATGRLADPSDLPFDAELLDDPEALTAAVDELLARKPHLASRTPRGDVGQGPTGGGSGAVDLLEVLRLGA